MQFKNDFWSYWGLKKSQEPRELCVWPTLAISTEDVRKWPRAVNTAISPSTTLFLFSRTVLSHNTVMVCGIWSPNFCLTCSNANAAASTTKLASEAWRGSTKYINKPTPTTQIACNFSLGLWNFPSSFPVWCPRKRGTHHFAWSIPSLLGGKHKI